MNTLKRKNISLNQNITGIDMDRIQLIVIVIMVMIVVVITFITKNSISASLMMLGFVVGYWIGDYEYVNRGKVKNGRPKQV